ncbi:type II toxin-antitoxin system RelE/ParE family toxin [Nannocystaceae bacterium ST9]
MRVEFTDGAEADLEDALEWFESLGLRSRLGTEVVRGIDSITEAPHRWREIEPGVRRLILQRVPYAIVYAWLEVDARVVVLAIAHHRREPGYWRERP